MKTKRRKLKRVKGYSPIMASFGLKHHTELMVVDTAQKMDSSALVSKSDSKGKNKKPLTKTLALDSRHTIEK